jgi:NAD(P)-dependent dehydrogenase (short-subunit alcohol dehydrogenase family)
MSLLKNKVIVVTGSGRGIGREIALLCASLGAKVVVNDAGVSERGEGADDGPAADVAAEIRKRGGEAAHSTASVASWESAQSIVETAISNFGALDGVVNNAGILRDKIFHQHAPEDWDSVIKTHLYGSFYVSRAAAPHFRQRNGGAFVHMTSGSALTGNLGQANYMAAKLGIVGLAKSIALDMARYNVRSNCISPTAMSRLTGTIPSEQESRMEGIKKATPAKIAPLAAFLLSDLAKDVSGQIFGVRSNELFIFSQTRPVRLVADNEGWTPEKIASVAMPMFRPAFTPVEVSSDVFTWDPI